MLAAEPGREFAFRRDVLHCGVCDWRYRLEPEGGGTRLTESYEVVEPDWAITNWFDGLMLGVEDRNADLQEGLRTTLARIKAAAEREHAGAPPAPRTAERPTPQRQGAKSPRALDRCAATVLRCCPGFDHRRWVTVSASNAMPSRWHAQTAASAASAT